jgi:adenosylhomocysteine nucleosidase
MSCIEGLIVSGDQIIRSQQGRDKIRLNHPDAICVDMETAAIAQVALQNGVPWGAVRVVSDDANEQLDTDDVIAYGREVASDVIATILVRLPPR